MTLQRELDALRVAYPIKNGLRLRTKRESANRHAKAATLFTYLESGGGKQRHFAIHQTVFAKRGKPSNRWWAEYFNEYVFNGWKRSGTSVQRDGILKGGIIPAVNIRTGKIWSVRAIIGYALHDNARIVSSALRSRGGGKSVRG